MGGKEELVFFKLYSLFLFDEKTSLEKGALLVLNIDSPLSWYFSTMEGSCPLSATEQSQ